MKNMEQDSNNKILAIVYSIRNKFLLLKTNPKTMKLDKWYVVTGAVKKYETFEDAVKREVDEETKLKILKIKPTKISFDYEWPENSGIIKHEKVFLVKVKHNEPKISRLEHTNWDWLFKKEFIKQIYWYNESKAELNKILTKIPKLK